MSSLEFEIKGYNKKLLKFYVLPFLTIENDKIATSLSFGWLFWKVIIWRYKKDMKKPVSKKYIKQVKEIFKDQL